MQARAVLDGLAEMGVAFYAEVGDEGDAVARGFGEVVTGGEGDAEDFRRGGVGWSEGAGRRGVEVDV